MPLSIVDDTRCVVVDIVPELLGRVPISSIPSGRAAAPRDLLQSRRRPQTSDRSASPVCYFVSHHNANNPGVSYCQECPRQRERRAQFIAIVLPPAASPALCPPPAVVSE